MNPLTAVIACLLTLFLLQKEGEGLRTKTLFVVLDGFRYDYVKLFKTPNLEKLAGGENAFFHPGLMPVFPSTSLPNMASMITGNFSDSHGITNPNSFKEKNDKGRYSREYWNQLRSVGSIWDAYISSTPEGSKTRVPGLIDWPYSSMLDSEKEPRFKHILKSKDFERRTTQIKHMFNNESLDFVSIYVEQPGVYAVPYGPESRHVNESITLLDNWIGELAKEFKENTNIIITSTPGYLNASLAHVIYLNKILKDGTYSLQGSSPFLGVIPKEGEEIDIFRILAKQKLFKTYSKSEIPRDWHYKLESKVKIALLASEGNVFEDFFNRVKRFQSKHKIKEPLDRTYGLNGYANELQKSRSILLGLGPAFRKEGENPSSFERTEAKIVDIYPLLCHVLGIKIPSDREGSLEPFLSDLSSPPRETMEKIKEVIKRITNSPAAGTIGAVSLVFLLVFLCIMLFYRRKSKKLDHSYSYTQIRDNRRGDSETLEEEFEKVEFLGIEDEFHEAEEFDESNPKEDEADNNGSKC